MEKGSTRPQNIAVTPADKQRIDALAKVTGRPRTTLVRDMLDEYLTSHKDEHAKMLEFTRLTA